MKITGTLTHFVLRVFDPHQGLRPSGCGMSLEKSEG